MAVSLGLVAAILVLAWSSSLIVSPGPGPDDGRPDLASRDLSCEGCNILLLNIELLRADHVGLIVGDSDRITPNIDRFFSDSLIFEDASAPAGETYRSNLSVQSSRHAFHFEATEKEIHAFMAVRNRGADEAGLGHVADMLLRFPTMAEYFSAHGYETILLNQGRRAGESLMLDRGFTVSVNWGRGFVPLEQTIESLIEVLGETRTGPFLIHYRPETLHPFPYYYPESMPIRERSEDIVYHHRPAFGRFSIRFPRNIPEHRRITAHQAIYRQQVRYVDESLAQVFRVLEERGIAESTIVVLYSNHGSGVGDNGVHRLAVSYQSCIHVPLMIRHPKVQGPIRVTAPVALIDLLPTLLDVAAIETPLDLEGTTLLRDFASAPQSPTPLIGRNDYDEYIRDGDFKLIVFNAEFPKLFDVVHDPHETKDLADERPALVQSMRNRLESLKLAILHRDDGPGHSGSSTSSITVPSTNDGTGRPMSRMIVGY